MAAYVTRKGEMLQDPPLIQKLLSDPRAGWIWLLPRLWLSYQWIDAASHKIANPAWMQTGEALKGFWTNAVAVTNGRPVIAFDWYRGFIQGMLDAQAYTWFASSSRWVNWQLACCSSARSPASPLSSADS
jgi:thiosulfate dehydrogenase [quinone] large subunit